ncbi:conserved membrane protein of unknown function [Thermococcus nautili]|uniref:hypothetical protein n=1 Tax=Thermococcus nautili TaxID=195522 RepID=UPI00255488C2|nr:hypothetical protein [Thermococcus nautili]CAI1492696.1 conserved membrane protein of unknown function [Thermococcus nautili]
MNEFRIHNLLTFYIPFLILIVFVYEFFSQNSKALVYVMGNLVAYLAIRLEIHHYTHKWGFHRNKKFVKILIIYDLFAVGFLLPTIFTYSTRATLVKNILIYIVVVFLIYVPISKMIDKLMGRGLLVLSGGFSLIIFLTAWTVLVPLIFMLLSLWTWLLLKHNLVSYTQYRAGGTLNTGHKGDENKNIQL